MTVFEYQFRCQGQSSQLIVDVPIPLSTSTNDFCERLSQAHQLPCFVIPNLKTLLEDFVAQEEHKFHSMRANDAVEKLKQGSLDKQAICNRWSQAFSKQVKKHSDESLVTDSSFSSLYKKLIHSPSLMSILNVEHAFAMAVQDVIRDRDRTLAELERRQREEMDEALSGGVGSRPFTDTQISNLAQLHIERLESQTGHWEKELADTKRDQKIQYLDWLKSIDEDPQRSAMKARSLSQTASNSFEDNGERLAEGPVQRLEESFTIHLGAQLKTTHNLRLLSADILDLCRHTANFASGRVVAEPQRLQTALSLYSHKLCGMVLLVDDRLNSYSGIKREFAAVCGQSTDFHFPDLSEQLELVEVEVLRHNEEKPRVQHDSSSVKSGSSESSIDSQERKSRLRLGSFYVTKHSNLSEVHTVFHLVADDTLLLGDINSRHSVILGLRNVLKACFKSGIVTLTIPLLLTLEMAEEMTIPWCLKRAELVFKCVKGFMMEMSTWADSESRTIQFIVPKDLSVDTFNMLSNMLPGIFRQSNPIVGR